MIKSRLILAGVVATALLTPLSPALAQEQQTALQQDSVDTLLELADLPLPTVPLIAQAEMEGGPEIAEGPGGGPGGGGHERWHHHGPFPFLEGSLAVTDDQIEKLSGIEDAFKDSVGPKALLLHTNMRHLMEALGSSSIDSAKVRDLQSQIASLKSDMSRLETDKLIAFAGVFTPEQRHAMREEMLRRKVGMMMMHHDHHMHGHGGGHEHH